MESANTTMVPIYTWMAATFVETIIYIGQTREKLSNK